MKFVNIFLDTIKCSFKRFILAYQSAQEKFKQHINLHNSDDYFTLKYQSNYKCREKDIKT